MLNDGTGVVCVQICVCTQRRRGAISADGDEAASEWESNYKLVGFTSPRPQPPPSLPYIALGLAALGNHGYNGGMGLRAPLQNNLLIPYGERGKGRRGVNLGVTGQVRRPDNESTPDTRHHPSLSAPPSTTQTSPRGRNQQCCQPWESSKAPGPDIGLPSQPGLELGRSIRPLLHSVFHLLELDALSTALKGRTEFSKHAWEENSTCTRRRSKPAH